jgi:hypothetical protein
MKFIKDITYNQFLIFISILIFTVFTVRDFFPNEIQIWITTNVRVFSSSILITLIARLIGILKSEDFDINGSFPQIYALQMYFSYFYDDKLLDSGTLSYYFIWLFPTMIFIARRYFKRIQRIENMLTELKNEIKQLNQVEGIDTPTKIYQDENMVQLPDGTWDAKDG